MSDEEGKRKRENGKWVERFIRGNIPFAIYLLPFALLLASCNKSPFDRTQNALGGALGTAGPSAGAFVIFSDELRTGGGAFLYPGGENQTLSFADRSNPISQRSIRYSWTGGDVSWPGGCTPTEHTFAGFDLMDTPTLATYSSTPGRDLHLGGYTTATFYSHGSLSTNTVLKVEVAASGVAGGCVNPPQVPCLILYANASDLTAYQNYSAPPTEVCPAMPLTGNWQSYSIPIGSAIANSSQPAFAIKDFFKATFVFTPLFVGSTAPGQGGTVYFDVIQYQP
jgi:hypothetical protein